MHFTESLHDNGSVDVFALKDRLHALFSRYGQVLRLDLVRADQGNAQRVMCFLRMSTPEQEQAVVDALGMGRFGGDLVMVVSLQPPAPGLFWQDSEAFQGHSVSWR